MAHNFRHGEGVLVDCAETGGHDRAEIEEEVQGGGESAKATKEEEDDQPDSQKEGDGGSEEEKGVRETKSRHIFYRLSDMSFLKQFEDFVKNQKKRVRDKFKTQVEWLTYIDAVNSCLVNAILAVEKEDTLMWLNELPANFSVSEPLPVANAVFEGDAGTGKTFTTAMMSRMNGSVGVTSYSNTGTNTYLGFVQEQMPPNMEVCSKNTLNKTYHVRFELAEVRELVEKLGQNEALEKSMASLSRCEVEGELNTHMSEAQRAALAKTTREHLITAVMASRTILKWAYRSMVSEFDSKCKRAARCFRGTFPTRGDVTHDPFMVKCPIHFSTAFNPTAAPNKEAFEDDELLTAHDMLCHERFCTEGMRKCETEEQRAALDKMEREDNTPLEKRKRDDAIDTGTLTYTAKGCCVLKMYEDQKKLAECLGGDTAWRDKEWSLDKDGDTDGEEDEVQTRYQCYTVARDGEVPDLAKKQIMIFEEDGMASGYWTEIRKVMTLLAHGLYRSPFYVRGGLPVLVSSGSTAQSSAIGTCCSALAMHSCPVKVADMDNTLCVRAEFFRRADGHFDDPARKIHHMAAVMLERQMASSPYSGAALYNFETHQRVVEDPSQETAATRLYETHADVRKYMTEMVVKELASVALKEVIYVGDNVVPVTTTCVKAEMFTASTLRAKKEKWGGWKGAGGSTEGMVTEEMVEEAANRVYTKPPRTHLSQLTDEEAAKARNFVWRCKSQVYAGEPGTSEEEMMAPTRAATSVGQEGDTGYGQRQEHDLSDLEEEGEDYSSCGSGEEDDPEYSEEQWLEKGSARVDPMADEARPSADVAFRNALRGNVEGRGTEEFYDDDDETVYEDGKRKRKTKKIRKPNPDPFPQPFICGPAVELMSKEEHENKRRWAHFLQTILGDGAAVAKLYLTGSMAQDQAAPFEYDPELDLCVETGQVEYRAKEGALEDKDAPHIGGGDEGERKNKEAAASLLKLKKSGDVDADVDVQTRTLMMGFVRTRKMVKASSVCPQHACTMANVVGFRSTFAGALGCESVIPFTVMAENYVLKLLLSSAVVEKVCEIHVAQKMGVGGLARTSELDELWEQFCAKEGSPLDACVKKYREMTQDIEKRCKIVGGATKDEKRKMLERDGVAMGKVAEDVVACWKKHLTEELGEDGERAVSVREFDFFLHDSRLYKCLNSRQRKVMLNNLTKEGLSGGEAQVFPGHWPGLPPDEDDDVAKRKGGVRGNHSKVRPPPKNFYNDIMAETYSYDTSMIQAGGHNLKDIWQSMHRRKGCRATVKEKVEAGRERPVLSARERRERDKRRNTARTPRAGRNAHEKFRDSITQRALRTFFNATWEETLLTLLVNKHIICRALPYNSREVSWRKLVNRHEGVNNRKSDMEKLAQVVGKSAGVLTRIPVASRVVEEDEEEEEERHARKKRKKAAVGLKFSRRRRKFGKLYRQEENPACLLHLPSRADVPDLVAGVGSRHFARPCSSSSWSKRYYKPDSQYKDEGKKQKKRGSRGAHLLRARYPCFVKTAQDTRLCEDNERGEFYDLAVKMLRRDVFQPFETSLVYGTIPTMYPQAACTVKKSQGTSHSQGIKFNMADMCRRNETGNVLVGMTRNRDVRQLQVSNVDLYHRKLYALTQQFKELHEANRAKTYYTNYKL